MIRLIFLLFILAALSSFKMCSADMIGHNQQVKDNARCDRLAGHYLNHGLTEGERTRLRHKHCRELNGVWMSDRVYQA